MSAMLFAFFFPRAQRASTFDISAEQNVWLQSTLRSFAIVCDYMKTALFAIVCDHMETSLNVPTRNSLAVETKGVLFLWLVHLNNKGNVCKQTSVPMGTHQNTPCGDVDAKLYPLHSFESKMQLWNFSSTLIPWVNFTFAAKL